MPKRKQPDSSLTRRPRKRKTVTLETKLSIIRKFENAMKICEIAREFDLPQTTVRTITADKERILEAVNNAHSLNSSVIRKRHGIIAEMETLLKIWCDNQVWVNSCPVDQTTICKEAKAIFARLQKEAGDKAKDESFVASNGWFSRFKNRCNLHDWPSIAETGEAASDDGFHNLTIMLGENILRTSLNTMSSFRLGLVQLAVGEKKSANIRNALSHIQRAKKDRADVVVLPECFNSPYGTQHFAKYAETIPDGETSLALSDAAKKFSIYIVGGTIPERDNGSLYNTATVWDPQGNLIAKHRKMHLFDIDIKGKITFLESETLSPGDALTTFEVNNMKIGLGICYDIRFEEMARLYRNMGCHVLLYPAAFNTTTGPLHWSLLQRSRANDNQCYVACVSPARNPNASYVAWGHTQLTSPWAEVLHDLDTGEGLVVADIEMSVIEEVRSQIPIFNQRRVDLYDTILKKQEG